MCVELVWVFARTFLQHENFDSLPTANELRSSFGEFVKRMTGWFPFTKSSAASEVAVIQFGLSLNYAKLAAVLAPRPPSIVLPRRKDGWRYRVRATDAAWAGMKSSSGKAASNEAAFRMAAEWIEDCLVSYLPHI